MSIEEINVKNVYNKIAKEFSDTRYRPWTCVESFLDNVEVGCKIGDIGCGNGKNMKYREDCENYGCDFSEELVKICNDNGLNVVYGDILSVPFGDKQFDYTICIAVIHHLSTPEKRKKAIDEVMRVTKKGGKALILVWALEQPENSRRKFAKQDNMVTWKDKQGNLLGERYYYVFKKDELENLVNDSVTIIESFYELGNWGVILEKK
jgi:tRNA (uracil-5-)-methyltransferase TRM9